MDKTIETLINFVNAAEKSRKYAKNTADAVRAALRLFEKELNEEEKSSVDIFNEHLDQIYHQVVRNNQTKYTSGSLETYRRRVKKLIEHYNKYGKDPTKMNAWNPKPRTYKTREKLNTETKKLPEETAEAYDVSVQIGLNKFEIQTESNQKAVLIIPTKLSAADADKLKKLIDLNATI